MRFRLVVATPKRIAYRNAHIKACEVLGSGLWLKLKIRVSEWRSCRFRASGDLRTLGLTWLRESLRDEDPTLAGDSIPGCSKLGHLLGDLRSCVWAL